MLISPPPGLSGAPMEATPPLRQGGPATTADVFWALHRDLPREGVGSDATTRHLLALAGPLPDRPRALDLGCGPGRATRVLAAAGADVVALDRHEPFLRRLQGASAHPSPRGRVLPVRASMAALPVAASAIDLVWSEGAAYVIGVGTALRAWRRVLAPRGVLVLTDAVWTAPTPSGAAPRFWAEHYPAMRDERATRAAAEDAGCEVVATHLLPESDWWGEYYGPLEARIEAWPRPDEATAAALADHRAEIELRRAHPDDYGYAGFVLRRR